MTAITGGAMYEPVLVVSRSPEAFDQIASLLGAAGYEAIGSRAALEAYAIAAVSRPRLVLLEPGLPGGAKLAARLRTDLRCGQPVVAELGAGSGLDAGIDPGAQDFATRVAELVAVAGERRSSSPLTGLPGNTAIRTEIERRLAAAEPVALLYADLDSFKPYNDHYGFLRGDGVLVAFADLLVDEAARVSRSFVGHIGGDDFVVLAPPDHARELADQVVERFDAAVPRFYEPADAARGWIAGRDRRGRRRRWPLLTVSIGVAVSTGDEPDGALALVDVATELKSLAKGVPGSCVAVDRRTDTGPGRRTWPALRRALRVGSAAAVVLVLVVTPPAALAAAAARPGDTLWPVHRAAVSMRMAFADPDATVLLHRQEAARRRVDLAAFLEADAGQDRVRAALDELARHEEALARLTGEHQAGGPSAGLVDPFGVEDRSRGRLAPGPHLEGPQGEGQGGPPGARAVTPPASADPSGSRGQGRADPEGSEVPARGKAGEEEDERGAGGGGPERGPAHDREAGPSKGAERPDAAKGPSTPSGRAQERGAPGQR